MRGIGKNDASRITFFAALLVGALPSATLARDQSTATGTAMAEVLQPLRTISIDILSFGSISVDPNQSGAVRISAVDGKVEYLASVLPQCSSLSGCKPHRAMFAVRGGADRSYTVTISPKITAVGQRTGSSLTVSQMNVSSRNQPLLDGGGQLDREGRDIFYIGGTLEVPDGTMADFYRADFPVSVAYN